MQIIDNGILKVAVAELGAELKSIKTSDGVEHLWQAGPKFWGRTSPILFPIVGKLKEDAYFHKGQKYPLSQHGFARDCDFQILSKTNSRISFFLNANAESKCIFPFDFELMINYELAENQIIVEYQVQNMGNESMYFSIGAHPAFCCPWEENEHFEDYYLQFEKKETAARKLLENGVFNKLSEPLLNKEAVINLDYQHFEKDAIVFSELKSSYVELRSRKNKKYIRVSTGDCPHLGIWTKKDAPFLCIEPWWGLADSMDSDGDLSHKEGINALEAAEIFKKEFTIEFLEAT